MPNPNLRDIAKMIDHSILQPTMTDSELEAGIDLALEADVASICISPHYVRRLCDRVKGTNVKASTVIGFPHGTHTQSTKLHEAHEALAKGCDELDVVLNLGKIKSGDYSYTEDEMEALVSLTHDAGKKIKIIFETCFLNDGEKIRLCGISGGLKVDWVKTSTGFGSAGATPHDVALLRENSPESVQVKASGGITTLEQVLEYRKAGATRIGTSRTQEILVSLPK